MKEKTSTPRIILAALLASTFLTFGAGASGTVPAALAEGNIPPAASSPASPQATCPAGGQCFADVPSSNGFYSFINRIFMQNLVTGYPCGGPGEPCDDQNRPYYRPNADVTRQQMAKFIDNARHLPMIDIDSTAANIPAIQVRRDNTGAAILAYTVSGYGVFGNAGSGQGIRGIASTGEGVYGQGTIGVSGAGTTGVYGYSATTGVKGETINGYGVKGVADTGYAIYGQATGTGRAGYFQGDVTMTGSLHVNGSISKGGGSFKIDDPLDPANKYLYHSFVESPDMMNVYNGNITTDSKGEAVVTLPAYFQALNRDFRYQLTVMGQFAQAIVAEKISDNHFTIKTDKPNVEVSWQVTGIRQDPYANAHRIPNEEEKPNSEKGKYLHPTEWGQPASLGIDYSEQQAGTPIK